MPDTLKILKLGGSVITYKDRDSALNEPRLTTLIHEIKQWLAENPTHQLIIIAGAGSFGHPLAHKYVVNAPTPDKDPMGFLATTTNMRHMGVQVAQLFHVADVPVFPISPSDIFTTTEGRIASGTLMPFTAALERGLIPLVWGDAVFDTAHQYRILSGDQINTYLCEQLAINTLLFGTDVAGIYDANPAQNPDAHLIPHIDNDNYTAILGALASSQHVDVTGGMRGKIAEIYATRLRPLRCTIYDAHQDGHTYQALRSAPIGTRITFD